MRIKNLFYILLAATFVFASCSKTPEEVKPTPEPQPEPQPDPEVEYLYDMAMQNATRIPNYILEVAFEDGRVLPDHLFAIGFNNEDGVLEFAVTLMGNEGDNVLQAGSYTMENGGFVIYPEFEQSVDVDDKEYLIARGDVKVEGDENGYTFDIVLEDTEGNFFHFTYEGKVALMVPVETPEQGVEFVAQELDGYMYVDFNVYNLGIILSDEGVGEELETRPNATYYHFDIYTTEVAVDASGYVRVPNGTYTLDTTNSYAVGTIVEEASSYMVTDETGVVFLVNETYDDATVVVTDEGISVEAVIGGYPHTVTYEGEPKFFVGIDNPVVEFEASLLDGIYYGTSYSSSHNYYIFLSDIGFGEDVGIALPGGTYYQLDLYGAMGDVDAEGYIHIPAGTYTLDNYSTLTDGTVASSYSKFFKLNAEDASYDAHAYFEACEVVVTENGITINSIIDGVEHIVTYNGTPKLRNPYVDDTPEENVCFEALSAIAVCYGDEYSPGISDNYCLILSDLGFDTNGSDLPGGTYYRLDLYAPLASGNHDRIPAGTYTVDTSDSYDPWTLCQSYSSYYIMDEFARDYLSFDVPGSGTLVVGEDGSISATITMMTSGVTHEISCNADDIVFYDSSSDN